MNSSTLHQRNIFRVIALVYILLFAGIVYSQTKNTMDKSEISPGFQLQQKQPYHLRHADHFKWDTIGGKNVSVLYGNVTIFFEKDNITISSDTVWYYSETKTYKAQGHVKIIKEDKIDGRIVATSQKAMFDQNKNQITLEINPKILHGKDELKGEILIITFHENGTSLEGSNVSGVLYPETDKS